MRAASVLLHVAACLAVQAAVADVVVRDEAEQGVVLSNLADPPVAAPLGSTGWQPRPQPAPTGRAGPGARPDRSRRWAPLVRAAAKAHGLPEALLQAVIEVESGFDPGAVSAKGALGLMQLMPGTARALGVGDARDPAANVDGGARYLKDLLARYGDDLTLALAAYNAGPGAVQRSGGMPRLAETQAYVPRVIARYHRLQSGAE